MLIKLRMQIRIIIFPLIFVYLYNFSCIDVLEFNSYNEAIACVNNRKCDLAIMNTFVVGQMQKDIKKDNLSIVKGRDMTMHILYLSPAKKGIDDCLIDLIEEDVMDKETPVHVCIQNTFFLLLPPYIFSIKL